MAAVRRLDIKEIGYFQSLIQSAFLKPILQEITDKGGAVFLVGGAVRDLLLKRSVKDLDFEVHNLTQNQLQGILSRSGEVNSVGKSFGVFKTRVESEIDWSLPRSDSLGRRPDVTINPTMTIESALRRRDFTINAMALNIMTYELHDPFQGEKDLINGVLQCPDRSAFPEDPLRFFRVMQFMGRFEVMPSDELNELCRAMDISAISRERIEEELRKLLLKSKEPSRGFRWIRKVNRLNEIFPELAALVNVSQDQAYHPEGNVWEHTMQVLDAAADVRKFLSSQEEKLALMYAALCHDLGKADATIIHEDGRMNNYGHEAVSAIRARQLVKRVSGNKALAEKVRKLVLYHKLPEQLIQVTTKSANFKWLALKLAPETNARQLALLFEADCRGRNGNERKPLRGPVPDAQRFLQKMNEACVSDKPEEPVLRGRDLLDVVSEGPELGELIKMAYEIQIEEGIGDKEELKKRVLESKNSCS